MGRQVATPNRQARSPKPLNPKHRFATVRNTKSQERPPPKVEGSDDRRAASIFSLLALLGSALGQRSSRVRRPQSVLEKKIRIERVVALHV